MTSKKKRRTVFLSLILGFCFCLSYLILDYADGNIKISRINLNIAIEYLNEEFNHDYPAIIEYTHNQIESNEANYDVAINMTLLMHYHYLIQDYDYVIDHFQDVTQTLESLNLQVELLHLYSIISNIYLTQERYELAYAYTQKADMLCNELLEVPFITEEARVEYESRLATIKYMKVSILLRLDLLDLAKQNFEEAEMFRKEADIPKQANIYFNIINYYAAQNNYELVQKYYDRLLALDGGKITAQKANATIYMARLQIKYGDIENAIKSLEYVSNYHGNSAIIKSNIYEIYSLLYTHYEQPENALATLKTSYDLIKDSPYNSKHKMMVVDKIITLSESLDQDANDWYKIYHDLDKSTVDTKSVQLMLGQLLDLELAATKEKQSAMKLEFVNIILIFIVVIILLSGILTQITRKNYEDGLTKIYNRKLFNLVYHRLLRRKQEFYILMLDIDNFKLLNDTYGHEFGDKVLIDISQKLKSILPSHCRLYRYGGEEFVVIVKKQNQNEVLAIAEQLRQTVETMKWDNLDHITISIGCASFKASGKDVLSKADAYLYISKKTGKNKVTI